MNHSFGSPASPQTDEGRDTAGAQTLRRGLAVLKLLARSGAGGLRMGEIGRRLALHKTTAVRLTRTLLDEQFLVHDSATRCYRLGPEAFAVGLAAEPSYTLQRMAAPHLRALAVETGEAYYFSVVNGLEIICLSRESGDIPLPRSALKVGDRNPLGIGAAGVAILSAMADDEIDSVLRANAAPIDRDYPECPVSVVRHLLEQAREQGYSVIPGLIVKDFWALGVPLCGANGRPEAAISLVTSAARLPPSRQAALGERLVRLSADLMGLAGAGTGRLG